MRPQAARVLLTGAGGGIGQPVAHALLKAGAAVMLVGRSSERLRALAAQLAIDTGVNDSRINCQEADVTRIEHIARLASQAQAWQCNVVVHGAGLPAFGSLKTQDSMQLQAVLQTNLVAPMLLTQALLRHLQQLPHAQVICIGSALGRIGLPGYSVYSASKFGLRGFAEALRRELRESHVKVQYLGPRSTDTPFNDARVGDYNRATGTAVDRPERVAIELMRLLRSEAAERFYGFPESFAVRLNGIVPSWLDGAFKRHSRQLPGAGSRLDANAMPRHMLD
ncbi:SDR family oxidoreductase [Hydrogenophaga sp.]|uniref:SDR family oxidoreductase n=1 Tax=Hydrogenophaga sp. TaxID=1904254 RepID=UPI00271BE0A2|nr:SDR family oxidoreductase [Hydrogenophaga sp.]MDO9436766.1 SDR family oxidoreductase [Hydrogenophaga sp.]